MQGIEQVVTNISNFLWGAPLIVLLAGAGIISTIYLGLPQIKYFGQGFKEAFGGVFKKEEKREGSMTSFQSLATAIAAQVGTGNIAGVGTAIVSGGPGAVFWMWVLGFLGMATIQVEALLAQKYRETTHEGDLVGGPAYYLKHGFVEKGKAGLGKFLAGFFAIAIVLALGIIGNMVQANSISDALGTAFGVNQIVVGIILAIIAAFVFIGGMQRIASFAEKVVPVMALIYIIGAIALFVKFSDMIGPVFSAIFKGAFSGQSVLAGTAGYAVKQAVRYGAARGLFSNEAGMGSTPNSHAVAHVDHPVQQAMVASVGVFIDTGIVCTVTALVILCGGGHLSGQEGVGITMASFQAAFGPMGAKFLAIALTAFAFTTLIGWYYFGEGNIRFLTKDSMGALRAYQVAVFLAVILGSALKVEFVWQLADFGNALMVIPNAIGVLLLMPQAKRLIKDYQTQVKSGEPLTYDYAYERL